MEFKGRKILLAMAAVIFTLVNAQQCDRVPIMNGPLSMDLPNYPPQRHPLQPTPIWGNLQAPYPTNGFFSNVFLEDGANFPIMPYPYHVGIKNDGVSMTIPYKTVTNDFIIESFIQNLMLECTENTNRVITSYDHLSVTVQWNQVGGGSMSCPIVRGSPYITMEYRNLTPKISTIHAILSVNGRGQPGTVTGTSFVITMNNGQTWKIYSLNNKALSFSWTISGLLASAPFSGVLRATLVRDPSHLGQLDTSSETYPVGCSVSTTYCPSNPNEAFINFNWATKGNQSNLLMLALPHQMDSIVAPNVVIQNGYPSMKGSMTGLLGNNWMLKETLTSIGYSAPTNIPEAKKVTIRNALERDKHKRAGSFDAYWNGKELAAMGRLALIADELGETETAALIRRNLKQDMENWFVGANANPLKYDTTWKGICTAKGLENATNDFGQGYYNDHHFHYGYFIYAAAALGKSDKTWLLQRKDKIFGLLRDYANPSSSDPYFPVTRNKDWYDGHSWASGLFAFGDAKNQESTSESVNSYYAIHLLGLSLGDSNLSMWGRLLLATELRSVKKYWHMKSDSNIYEPQFAANKIVGVLWSSKVDYTTFFGNNVEYIHCIQMMPFTPITEELLPADFVEEEYPVLSKAFTRPTPGLADDWKVLIHLDHSIIDSEAAWNEIQSIRYFDNGNTMTNSLYFAATRP